MDERLLKIASQKSDPFPRVLVTDRDWMSSQLLAEALGRNRYEAAAVFSSDLIAGVKARKAQVVVIGVDLHSVPDSGLELASTVCRTSPEVVIVILLDQINRESVINAFRSGAHGVFYRRRSVPEFLECIDHVSRGGIWTDKTQTNYLLEMFKNIPYPTAFSFSTSPSLTRRELDVVKCAARGQTNKTIAKELCLSEHTVKNYLFRAFEKLGVSNRIELVFQLMTKKNGFSLEGAGNPASHDSPGQISRLDS